MENIFKDAKFGDKFLTRGGSIAILTVPKTRQIMLEDLTEYLVMSDGLADDDMPSYDIVSRYQEPIDEEKLDDLAEQYCNSECFETNMEYIKARMAFQSGFKVGCHSAFNN